MPNVDITFETKLLSSLSKVFADEELVDAAVAYGSALINEVYSFQVAYRASATLRSVEVAVDSPLLPWIAVRSIGLVPSEVPAEDEADAGYLRKTPGLYPDLLQPIAGFVAAYRDQWRAVWITVALGAVERERWMAFRDGVFPIRTTFTDPSNGQLLGEETFTLEIIPAELPEQRLLHTEWFHCDCLASYYGLDVFGEEHWKIIERYVRNAVAHGVNTLLTPIFTPPPDTAEGGERPTVQLVGVARGNDGSYKFDFASLTRWVDMCRRAGIKYLEFSHLFTQWGAKHAPKIVAMTAADGKEERIFGWETEAGGSAYRSFLDQFLPELVQFIREQRLDNDVFFHVSDEPHRDHLEQYRLCSEILKKHLAPFAFIEALSSFDFYKEGIVQIPIPASDQIEPFLEEGVSPLWTYYCCGQQQDVSNRFFAQPSARNRVLGLQLFKFDIQGFLHWGYNFWYAQYSVRPVDPYRVTDAGGAFSSGAAFVVYPGPEGPLDSIRWEVFREALQDVRALELLAGLTGKKAAQAIVEQGLAKPLTFREYPSDIGWLLAVRENVNGAIRQAVCGT